MNKLIYIEYLKRVKKRIVTMITEQLNKVYNGETIDDNLYFYMCGQRDSIGEIIKELEKGGKK